ncbi:hypothetical protein L198_05582 [Cryptococcus wingfieldii CBS 7118]|uniref:Hemerythrin-like domain-containing protein n=2 Tax=Cryptococcus TaxID=5206 RepID=A0A1E3IW13_9TREE|nr:hypothetical protein L198_05582 [Cryptococcus wingfieldii CBS 7118]ODN92787.1 hypothetical protein L198_05582 [Cryptococcus wingfieldii CBS 7118]TYJ56068.1 hypothetical protein B9479_003178 [Cryptococcus floricola]
MPRKVQPDAEWNRLAVHMDMFHSHFRMEFAQIYELADGKYEQAGMTLSRFLREATSLSSHLDLHHRIEEAHIFPILAKKMPQFQAGKRESGEHLHSHKLIHDGLDRYDAFLAAAQANPKSYDGVKLREVLDSFKEVLFRHLDEEVKDLGAESMKAAGWTIEEVRRIPM